MTKSTVRIEALEKRVEEILAWVNEKPTREELTRELESVYLIVEQRDKRIEALEEKIEYLLAMVAKLSEGEGEPIELEATQDPKGEGEPIELEATQDPRGEGVPIELEATQNPRGEGVPIELEATQNPMHERNTRLGNLESRMLNLEAVASDMEELAESLKAISISHNSLVGAVDDIKEDVRETVKIIQGDLHELEGKVRLLIRAASNPITGSYEVGNTKIPEPKAFGGARDAKEVDNFLFDIELYFNATKNNSDESRLTVVPMYLTEDAKLWWRTKVEETISGQCSIASWDDFKRELKAQFYPENVAYNARCKLNDLQQTGSIREYVREFSTLMLNIKDMTGTDRLFNFLKGLKPWVKNELMRQNVKELKTALAIAESLDDYSANTSKRKFDSSPSLDNRPKWGKFSSGGVNKDYSPFEGTKSKSWGFKTRADRPTNLGREPNERGSWNDQSPRINSMIMTEPKQWKCYLCDGSHRFTDCPHKSTFNVLRAIREEEKGLKGKEQREDDSTPSMVGAIRFLGALKKQKHKPSTEKGLIYVDLWINGKAARALVDTGATDNFIADRAALQFQLNMQEDTGKIKAVNSKATNIVGVARRVSCQMGPWNGEIDFTVIPLDDFDVVIGMEFLKKARAIPIPIADCLLLMGDKPCIVPTNFISICEKKLIASLQLTRSAKNTEPTHTRDKHEIIIVTCNWEALGIATGPSGATGRHWALPRAVGATGRHWALPRARRGNWEALGTATGLGGNWEALGTATGRRGQLGGTGHCHGPVV
ncbi:hypothetical protein GH714_044032 [Hevea brasiliensis]|uniref:Retrotransposon gag domain-containing protein n=1 Tax=Hevea brasiliensis TaxID=3981 RepID=A0A6A6K2F9_HEVBR|nr:hypothetical protein GH714_044032 [Hevea brasiliensis]